MAILLIFTIINKRFIVKRLHCNNIFSTFSLGAKIQDTHLIFDELLYVVIGSFVKTINLISHSVTSSVGIVAYVSIPSAITGEQAIHIFSDFLYVMSIFIQN